MCIEWSKMLVENELFFLEYCFESATFYISWKCWYLNKTRDQSGLRKDL